MPKPKRLARDLPLPAQSRFLWWAEPPVIRAVGRAFLSLRIERQAILPPPPFVVASNHYSHFDSPAIAAALDLPIRYLALEDLFDVNPLLDWLIDGFGAIPTPRDRLPYGALRVALGRLAAGEAVGVFPEATRVSHWGTLPPKRGAAWLSVRAEVPLVPVAVIGTGRAFGLDNRLRRAQIRIVIGEAMSHKDTDATVLTKRWADWMTSQISRYPGSETSGPKRAYHGGT